MESREVISSPIGNLEIIVSDAAVLAVNFTHKEITSGFGNSRLLETTISQLREYFEGERTQFNLPLAPKGTEFQKNVWELLETIPYGETKSYKEMALALGSVKKIRAAASANGKNPIPIIIPCHRVIGSDGSLTGFSGGLEKKQWLLEFESAKKQYSLFE